jgi:hypothetical protein
LKALRSHSAGRAARIVLGASQHDTVSAHVCEPLVRSVLHMNFIKAGKGQSLGRRRWGAVLRRRIGEGQSIIGRHRLSLEAKPRDTNFPRTAFRKIRYLRRLNKIRCITVPAFHGQMGRPNRRRRAGAAHRPGDRCAVRCAQGRSPGRLPVVSGDSRADYWERSP